MSNNRWKVYKVGDSDHFLWWADNESLPHYRGQYFGTHAEALDYADSMARTVEVTLPRDPDVWESGWDSDRRIYVEETNGNEICYEPGGLGEIALRLLAYHYRETQE